MMDNCGTYHRQILHSRTMDIHPAKRSVRLFPSFSLFSIVPRYTPIVPYISSCQAANLRKSKDSRPYWAAFLLPFFLKSQAKSANFFILGV